MTKKGFTLVELLVSLAILSLILVIAIPSFGLITKKMNETMYQNKISFIETSAELWANETGLMAVNVEHLILEGKLEADNESGDFLNPINKESLLCHVIRLTKDDTQWNAFYTEELVCDYEEIAKKNSAIEIRQFHANGSLITNETKYWSKDNITAEITFKPDYVSYIDSVSKIMFQGNESNETREVQHNFLDQNTFFVNANQLLNHSYEASVSGELSNKPFLFMASSDFKIDKQRPLIYESEIVVNNHDIWTNTKKKVTFTMSDGSGSGIQGYRVSNDKNCVNQSYIKTNKNKVSVLLGNGTYYICARDFAGNLSEDISTKEVVVTHVDTTNPLINQFSVQSDRKDYNNFQTILSLSATDESSLSMYISNGGYLTGGSWESYNPTKNWPVGTSLDGNLKTIYLSIRDESGNISHKSVTYQVYKECGSTYIVYTSGFDTCTKSCGSGTQKRSYINQDKITKKQCGAVQYNYQNCNTHGCCSSTSVSSYGNYGSCSAACGNGLKYRPVYYKSNYDGSACGSSTESTGCNLKSCVEYRYQKKQPSIDNINTSKPSTENLYSCTCLYGTPVGTISNIEYEGGNGWGYASPAKSCNPNKYFSGFYTNDLTKCTSYMELPFGGKICTAYKQIPVYSTNTPMCHKISYPVCSSGSLEMVGNDLRCVTHNYTCPSGMSLNGTMCFGAWSNWSSNPVQEDQYTNVEMRNP